MDKMTDEKLIEALRDAADWHAGRHVARLATQAADRLEAALSASDNEALPARPVVSESDLNSFRETVRRIIDGSFYDDYDRDSKALGPLRRILSALEGEA